LPTYPTARYHLGLALKSSGEHQQALDQFEAALALTPDFREARNNRGTSLAALGRHADALTCFEQSLKLSEQHADTWANRGVMIMHTTSLGQLDKAAEAVASFGRAVALEPTQAKWAASQGQAKIWYGQFKAATEQSKIAAEQAAAAAAAAAANAP
jgi:tetratricopeptide (TPR) repeat protein